MARGRRNRARKERNDKRRETRERFRDDRDDPKDPRNKYRVAPKWSRTYREYYAAQGVARDEADLEAMMDTLAQPLPATVRLHAEGNFADSLRERLKGELSEGYPVFAKDDETRKSAIQRVDAKPEPIPWYPAENGWRLGCDRATIRKLSGLSKLKSFLINETEAGNVTRQEEASMIPPFFLDVQPEHRVLDMCAAPGSKTSQLLEALHAKDAERGFLPPAGMVVANDANENRAYMLVKQSRRMDSGNLLVTAHEAQSFPRIEALLKDDGSFGFFDRVLADVPCSGDGTARKSPDVWTKFEPANGYTLHPLQLMIANRGLELLKVGGLMVYSTCSLNPIENEAVVAQLLRAHKGAVELVDTSETLPLLKRRPGLCTWRMAIQQFEEKGEGAEGVDAAASSASSAPGQLDGAKPGAYLKWLDAPDSSIKAAAKIPETAWPPSADEAQQMHLERCMRIMPNDNDTSGFFVCLLRKTADLDKRVRIRRVVQRAPRAKTGEATEGATNTPAAIATLDGDQDAASVADDAEAGASAGASAGAPKDAKEEAEPSFGRNDSYQPLPLAMYERVKDYYGILEGGPSVENLFWRVGGGEMLSRRQAKKRRMERADQVETGEHKPINITYVSKEVADLILSRNEAQKVRIVAVGTVVFKRNQRITGENSEYRISQNGIRVALPFVTKRKVEVALADLAIMWKLAMHEPKDPAAARLIKRFHGTPLGMLSSDTQQKLRDKNNAGGSILMLGGEEQRLYQERFGEPLALSFWVGSETVTPMINKLDFNGVFDKLCRVGLYDVTALDGLDVDQLVIQHLPSEADINNKLPSHVAESFPPAEEADDVPDADANEDNEGGDE